MEDNTATEFSSSVAPRLRFHDVVNVFPEATAEERKSLRLSIEARGVLNPVDLWRDPSGELWIIDGRHRVEIASVLGVDCQTREFVGTESEMFQHVMDLNFARRNLSSGQRAAIVVKAEMLKAAYRNPGGRSGPPAKQPGPEQPAPKGRADEELASRHGTNRESIRRAQQIKTLAPELLGEVINGSKSLPKALVEAKSRGHGTSGLSSDLTEVTTVDAPARYYDQLGHLIPPHLLAAWELSQAIERVLRQNADHLRKQLKDLAEDPAAVFLKKAIVSIDAQIMAASAEARNCKLFCLCPHCQAAGCKSCNAVGWLTAPVFRSFPEEVREKHAEAGRRQRGDGR